MQFPLLSTDRRARAVCVAAGVAAFLAYLPGLAGPFILDDHVNLAPIWQWLGGQLDATSAIFDNRSGPSGRPLSYATLLANAALGGTDAWGFKLFNVLLHLTAGLLAWHVLRVAHAGARRGAGDSTPAAATAATATALTAIWLLHPQHASSVLYVVQRMALLGAIAQLAAVLIYLHGRALLDTDARRGAAWLFLAFPACVGIGVLAKETAALAPLLCLVVEFTLPALDARATPIGTRLRQLFFTLFLGLPLLLGFVALLVDPARLTEGYIGREFTLEQRVLTQPRVLLDYAAHWFVPVQLALYRDGFPQSTGLVAPAFTLVAMLACASALATAIVFRRRRPLFAFGLLWFFAGHALEAGPLALEPYFEHRNYLPSLGLTVAAYALLRPWLWRLPTRAARVAGIALACVLVALTLQRSYHWGDADRLLAHEAPPEGEVSRRLQVDRAIRGFERGDAPATAEALAVLSKGPAGNRAAAAAWSAMFACDGSGRVAPTQLDALRANPPAVLTHNHVSWLLLLVRRSSERRCAGLEPAPMQGIVEHWAVSAQQPLSDRAQRELAAMRVALAHAQPAAAASSR